MIPLDHLSRAGAERLAHRIEKHWLPAKVKCTVIEVGRAGKSGSYFAVRSDMLDGLPLRPSVSRTDTWPAPSRLIAA
jgi:hypothetical protein